MSYSKYSGGFNAENFGDFKPYRKLKQKYPDAIVLIKQDEYFVVYSEDGELVAKACNLRLHAPSQGVLVAFGQVFLERVLPQLADAGHGEIVLVWKRDKKFKVLSRREFEIRFRNAKPDVKERPPRRHRLKPAPGQLTLSLE